MCPGVTPPADSACVPSVSFVGGASHSTTRAAPTNTSFCAILNDLHVDVCSPPKPPPAPPSLCLADVPPGSVIHHLLEEQDRDGSRLTSSPPDFPFRLQSDQLEHTTLDELPASLSVSDSVVRVVGCLRVFGLQLDSHSSVTTRQSGSASSLIDGGVNICVIGDLSIMVGIVDIHPLPITVAIKDSNTSVDDCCAKRGFIPLTVSDGSIHWQIIFFESMRPRRSSPPRQSLLPATFLSPG
jgi:hypothetical protein